MTGESSSGGRAAADTADRLVRIPGGPWVDPCVVRMVQALPLSKGVGVHGEAAINHGLIVVETQHGQWKGSTRRLEEAERFRDWLAGEANRRAAEDEARYARLVARLDRVESSLARVAVGSVAS